MAAEHLSKRQRFNQERRDRERQRLSIIQRSIRGLINPSVESIAAAIGDSVRNEFFFLELRVDDLIALFGLNDPSSDTRAAISHLLAGQGIDTYPPFADSIDDSWMELCAPPELAIDMEEPQAEAQSNHDLRTHMQVVANIKRSMIEDPRCYGYCRIKINEIISLCSFQEWSPENRDLIAKLLAANGLYHKPEIGDTGVDQWIILSAPLAQVEGLHPARSMVGYIVLASTLGPLVTAFCTELGKRFGGSAADWADKVRARRKEGKHSADMAEIAVENSGVTTILEITEKLTDEAKLALIDLDIEDPAVNGHRLTWDGDKHNWIAIDE